MAWLFFAAWNAAAEPRITAIEPARVMRDAATVQVKIVGREFGADAAVKFLATGTVIPGLYDVELAGSDGVVTRGSRLFFIEPYSWAARFGCTGAESSRRRIPCRR
jgi:hypothetical protein